MTKRIKRIAALILAGILLVCVSFASFAEEAEGIFEDHTEANVTENLENTELAEETVSVETTEIAEETNDTAGDDVVVEETAEGTETAEVTETNEETDGTEDTDSAKVDENAEEQAETAIEEVTEETTEDAQAFESEENLETEETEGTEESEEEYDELEGYTIPEDEAEYQELDDDAGYIDPEVVAGFIPEVTEELIEASERISEEDEVKTEVAEETEETEEIENTEETTETEEAEEAATVRAKIVREETEEAYIGDVIILTAKVESELNGEVRWEIRDEQWEEGIWQEIGKGKKLELTITEENADNLIRFQLEDGTISEEYRMNWTERPAEETEEETDAEEAAEEAVAEETEEAVEEVTHEDADNEETAEEVAEEDADNEEVTEEANEEETGDEEAAEEVTAEETEEETTDAAAEEIVADDEGTEAEEEAVEEIVNEETAETEETADEEITEEASDDETAGEETEEEDTEEAVTTFAWVTASEENEGPVTLNANADSELTGVCTWQRLNEEGEWKKIGYGDAVTVEAGEGAYRFVMQDGTVSEAFELTIATEAEDIAEDAAEEVTEEAFDAEQAEEAAEETTNEETTEAVAEEVTEETAGEVEEEIIPELPEDRTVNVVLTWDDEKPGFGSTAHFTAELSGYEGLQYTFQWMQSTDDVNWEPVEGETGETMDVVVTQDNYQMYWRVDVHVTGIYVD